MIKIKDKDESSAQNKLDEKAYWLINNLKEQWLEFLIECNSQTTTPDRNALIQKGYEIMQLISWKSGYQALYWKKKQNELDALKQQEYDKEEAFIQGRNEGHKEGKLQGEIKAEISKFKDFQKLGIEQEKYQEMFKYLKPENLEYIKQHSDETDSQIMGGMELEYLNEDHI